MRHTLLNIINPIAESTFTDYQYFKQNDMNSFQDKLDERLRFLSEDFLIFKSSEKIVPLKSKAFRRISFNQKGDPQAGS